MAQTGETVWIRCRLSRGLYTHERSYFIKAPGGGEYEGTVQIHFCRDSQHKPLADKHPNVEETGEVLGVVVRTENNAQLLVAIPGDQNIVVDRDQITETGGGRRVPLRA